MNIHFSGRPIGCVMASAPVATPTTAPQPVNRRRAKRPLLFPLAMTSLMQPLTTTAQAPSVTATNQPQPAQPSANPTPSVPSVASTTVQRPAADIVSDFYSDAAQIPPYAVDGIARATEAGIVVNYPDPRLLNPNQPATRGEVAAIIHQSLVHQGKINSFSEDEAVTNYIVGRDKSLARNLIHP